MVLFRKAISFILVVSVLIGIFASSFLLFEEISNYNYFKVTSTGGEMPINILNDINDIEGVYASVGLGYSLTSLNNDDVVLVWVCGSADIILKQFLVLGNLPSSSNGVLASKDLGIDLGENVKINGSSYVVTGFISGAFLSGIVEYAWTMPFIVVLAPIGGLKTVLVWVSIFSDTNYIKSMLAEVSGEHSFISRRYYVSNSPVYSVLLLTMWSVLATFPVVFLYFHRNRREYGVLLGVGWKVSHISRVFYLRYGLVFVISYFLSLFLVYVLITSLLALYFFIDIYLIFPIPTLFLNLIFASFFIKSFSRNFIEVLNN